MRRVLHGKSRQQGGGRSGKQRQTKCIWSRHPWVTLRYSRVQLWAILKASSNWGFTERFIWTTWFILLNSVRQVLLSLLVHKEIEISQLVSIGAGVGPGDCPQQHHASLLCPTGPLVARVYRIGIHSILGSYRKFRMGSRKILVVYLYLGNTFNFYYYYHFYTFFFFCHSCFPWFLQPSFFLPLSNTY